MTVSAGGTGASTDDTPGGAAGATPRGGRALPALRAALPVALLAAAGFAAALLPARAQQTPQTNQVNQVPAGYRLGDLTVSEVVAHQPGRRHGAAYLRVGNAGSDDDALIDASTPFARRVELHRPAPGGPAGGTDRIDAVPLPAGRETVLAPAAGHLRLAGLRSKLSAGQKVRITLTFERAGAITVEARVLSAPEAEALAATPVAPTPTRTGTQKGQPALPAGRNPPNPRDR